MPTFHWDIAQGSAEWFQFRRIPTASHFHEIMTPKNRQLSKQRKQYACQLIVQRILNWQPESLNQNEHIERGKENEPLAVAKLDLVFDVASKPIGFITNYGGTIGASPDRVAGVSPDLQRVNATIEVKCPNPVIQMERLLLGDNDAYYCQRQGQLLVAEADKTIFFSFHTHMPDYIVETGRDEAFIADLRNCLEIFQGELHELHMRALSLGAYQAFPSLLTPLDAERGPQRLADALMSEQAFDEVINRDLPYRFVEG